jgi:hypothetical protein
MNANTFYIVICVINEPDSEGLSETLKRYITISESCFMYSGPVVILP